jgi:hypothetical protein
MGNPATLAYKNGNVGDNVSGLRLLRHNDGANTSIFFKNGEDITIASNGIGRHLNPVNNNRIFSGKLQTPNADEIALSNGNVTSTAVENKRVGNRRK